MSQPNDKAGHGVQQTARRVWSPARNSGWLVILLAFAGGCLLGVMANPPPSWCNLAGGESLAACARGWLTIAAIVGAGLLTLVSAWYVTSTLARTIRKAAGVKPKAAMVAGVTATGELVEESALVKLRENIRSIDNNLQTLFVSFYLTSREEDDKRYRSLDIEKAAGRITKIRSALQKALNNARSENRAIRGELEKIQTGLDRLLPLYRDTAQKIRSIAAIRSRIDAMPEGGARIAAYMDINYELTRINQNEERARNDFILLVQSLRTVTRELEKAEDVAPVSLPVPSVSAATASGTAH